MTYCMKCKMHNCNCGWCGPQKQPSSLAKIKAEHSQTISQLNDFTHTSRNSMTVNQQALKAFNQFADNFDCDSDQWQDMGANEYFIAGFQAAQQSDDWNHAAKQCMNNLLDAHEKLDRDALTKALNSIRILTGR